MKLKISLALFALYIISLVATAPASLITQFIPSKLGVKIGHVSGSVWNGKFSQVHYRNQPKLQKLTWNFDWLALFALQLKADIQFDNGRTVLKGTGSVAYGIAGLSISDLNVDMQASELIPYLKLPIAVTPSGKFNLVVERGTQGAPYCGELEGRLVWHNAQLETPMANIDLASPTVDLNCTEGDLVASLTQDSDQLTTNVDVVLSAGGKYQLQGDIIGREKLDSNIMQALSWIGPQKESGETILKLQGRL